MESLTYEDRLKVSRWYADNMTEIMRSPGRWGIDKYSYPFLDKMTPIERMAFDEFIAQGVIPMWPEFPVGRFFVDLGNPHLKVALELDGKEFHTDWNADSDRDCELWNEHGWKIFRCSGSRCHVIKPQPSEDDTTAMIDWLHTTVDGLIYAMKRVLWDGVEDAPVTLDEICISELGWSRRYFEMAKKRKLTMRTATDKVSAAVELGRRGGIARAKSLTAEQRKASATKAAKKRWKQHKKKSRCLDN